VIESPPKRPSLQEAAEWVIRALRDEGLPVMMGGRAALDYLGEHTGSVDVDILVGTDFRGALSVLDAYAERGDLDLAGAVPGAVVRYLVSGYRIVDVMDLHSVHPRLFELLQRDACRRIAFGSAEHVDVVSREGYFVLAIMIGLRGFARAKEDPMMKVREAWILFGERTDKAEVDRLLVELDAGTSFDRALKPPAPRQRGRSLRGPSGRRGSARRSTRRPGAGRSRRS